jgi:hypothetical protein
VPSTTTSPDAMDELPSLDARAQGWLRHLFRKATTPDD